MKQPTQKKKQTIVKFVRAQGRGGIARAVEKFGISGATISKYVNESRTPARRGTRKQKRKSSSPTNFTELITPRLERIDELQESIVQQQESIDQQQESIR